MALLGPWMVNKTDPRLACMTACEAGMTLVFKTSGSGDVLGENAGQVEMVAAPSGKKVAGIALTDVISIDETLYHRNFQKVQQKIGERINLLKDGTVTTNNVTGTPTQGDIAYLTASGVLTPTLSTTGGLAATPKVGQFEGGLDANGYATVTINLPNL